MVSKDAIKKALTTIDKNSKERKFEQTIELVINFKGMDTKKPVNQIDVKVQFPHSTGKGSGKALLFARSQDFADKLKEQFSTIIMEDTISNLKKSDIQKILSHDVLLAEGPVMITVGKYLGQELAPRGKMPKPVSSENPQQITPMLESMKSTVRITNKKGKGIPLVQVVVGKESFSHEELLDNILLAFKSVSDALPRKKENIKSVFVKKTMGPAVKIGG